MLKIPESFFQPGPDSHQADYCRHGRLDLILLMATVVTIASLLVREIHDPDTWWQVAHALSAGIKVTNSIVTGGDAAVYAGAYPIYLIGSQLSTPVLASAPAAVKIVNCYDPSIKPLPNQ